MILEVRVIPKASRNKVALDAAGACKVYVTAAPERGKANKALIELLAGHFGVRKTDVRITRGLHAHSKVVEIHSVGKR
ncbi:MAG: DUF167 domain-containing protein [Candidatus Omnitrophica bacterium]|nr:DUF167 domain-containing protein [Candidatus Omnitrophota bacterium]MDD5574096.1 DUF167 domain-containing protein [Candidatus Omnitrophota bacterium]